ncbi:MAG TPA: VWA domain-containing protein [Bacteroidetes bacterium]|nr:VWA domain-containing protein [Bacteroidota bacterium]
MNLHQYFAQPGWLWLLWLLLPMILWYVWKKRKSHASLLVTATSPFREKKPSWRVWGRHILFVFRMLSVALLTVVLARPQSTDRWEDVSTEGIDIVMALDVSSSMLARDFSPDRLEAAKEVGVEFVSGRPYDRIGLVIFSGESFTQCPLTTDHATVINLLNAARSGVLEDGTAIGMGLATAINRLKDSEARSKVIILLTDGVNNVGEIDPLTAAEIASTFGIRVYTIGVGSRGTAPYPVQTPGGMIFRNMEVEIDEEVLQEIASMTEGAFYRATDKEKLRDIYREIDQLEKSKISVTEYRRRQEEYMGFAAAAVLLVMLELLLGLTVFKNFP